MSNEVLIGKVPDGWERLILSHEYVEQERRARLMMIEFETFACQIGCRVFGDEIISDTEEQAVLLDAKWKEINK